MKRAHIGEDDIRNLRKIRRFSKVDRISRLSDELSVRILSFVPVSGLLTIQRVSKKFNRLSVDSQLWKAAYCRRFMLPKITRSLSGRLHNHPLQYAKPTKCLSQDDPRHEKPSTNWKQRYRLQHNWARGRCTVDEIEIAKKRSTPPLLVVMSENLVYAADSSSGLRAWSLRENRDFLASIPLCVHPDTTRIPISMAIDAEPSVGGMERIVIAFEDGSFSIYGINGELQDFQCLFSHDPSEDGRLTALAYSSPYILAMTEDNLLSLYILDEISVVSAIPAVPRLLRSLRSHTVWSPVSLSLRLNTVHVTAAVAYSLPTNLSGWTIGIQELKLSHAGDVLESRLATAVDDLFSTLSVHPSVSSPSIPSPSPLPSMSHNSTLSSRSSQSRPTSISYSHPYIVATHPDNTLRLHIAQSTSSELFVSSGQRLWGHTSSVSGAHVSLRGKAVSVSRLGDEIRVWDLDKGMESSTARRRSRRKELSIRVRPSSKDEQHGHHTATSRNMTLQYALEQGTDDSVINRGWVGFDDSNVMVLREKSEGSQILAVYDFS